jgi:hypothetical protein
MRCLLVGLLVVATSSMAWAQAEGSVEAIGLAGTWRPNAWVPMKVSLRSKLDTVQKYRLDVVQEDLDRDRVAYSRPIVLNPAGRNAEDFWVYFRPQRQLESNLSGQALARVVRVYLCKPDGRQLLSLPFSPALNIQNLDDRGNPTGRGIRLVVGITSGESQPSFQAYSGAYGMLEDVAYVAIRPDGMPTSPLGYDAADHVVWAHPDPASVSPDAIAALEQWVRGGGKLVVLQGIDWQKMRDGPLAPMLPVTLLGAIDEPGAASLRDLGQVPDISRRANLTSLTVDPWPDVATRRAPLCLASPRPGAVVDHWRYRSPDDPVPPTPYLARWMWDYGSVTWVAQDLGSNALRSQNPMQHFGWVTIWDRVLGLRSRTRMGPDDAAAGRFPQPWREDCVRTRDTYPLPGSGEQPDVSTPFLRLTEASGLAAALALLAVFFFVVYGLIACLGSYFFLAARGRARHSWPAFALCALAGLAATLLFVRLALRRPPELKHVSFVRASPSLEARITSDIGLLIRADGNFNLRLPDASALALSTLTPYPAHPRQYGEGPEFIGYRDYMVPVVERPGGDPPALVVPFRSTMKKFHAEWVSRSPLPIEGQPTLRGGALGGVLVNRCGYDLREVFLVYDSRGSNEDTVYFLTPLPGRPAWPRDGALNLAALARDRRLVGTQGAAASADYGLLNGGWMRQVFDGPLRNVGQGGVVNDTRAAFVVASLFDRIEPIPRTQQNRSFLIHRWAGRDLDLSHAVAAGQMVILATAVPRGEGGDDGLPLPIPLELEGERLPGTGAVFLQFVVPIDRDDLGPPEEAAPTTRPRGG